MPDIFITNQNADYDYADTERYLAGGELIFMTRGFVQMKGNEDALLRKFSTYFETAKPEDYLLLSGPAILCSLATIAWSRKFDGATFLYNVHEKRDGKVVQVYQPIYVAPEATD